MIKKTCIHCGAEFEAKRSDAKFCSDKCRMAHKRNNRHDKICPVCGKHFIGTSNMKYCSHECYLLNRKINIRENHNPKNNPINNPKYNDKKRINDNATMTAAKHANPDTQFKRDKNGNIAYAYGTSECEQQLKKYEQKNFDKQKYNELKNKILNRNK